MVAVLGASDVDRVLVCDEAILWNPGAVVGFVTALLLKPVGVDKIADESTAGTVDTAGGFAAALVTTPAVRVGATEAMTDERAPWIDEITPPVAVPIAEERRIVLFTATEETIEARLESAGCLLTRSRSKFLLASSAPTLPAALQ